MRTSTRCTARRRVDSCLREQRPEGQSGKISVELLGPIGGIHGNARRARRQRENRDRHLGTIGQDDGDPITTADAHPAQRAPRRFDVLMKAPIGQRSAPGSENCRRVGNAARLVLQQVRQA